uniref:Uncharacterized protein n=1 Tax=Setaria viridis TaxID=4556 RepID=A0A4U6TBL5_SETVI|nr:hypothetical protein SEVIR_8G044150v2 [Setaria viridis]
MMHVYLLLSQPTIWWSQTFYFHFFYSRYLL